MRQVFLADGQTPVVRPSAASVELQSLFSGIVHAAPRKALREVQISQVRPGRYLTESLDGEDRMADRPGRTSPSQAAAIHHGGESMGGWVQSDGITAVIAALVQLDVRPEERVLVLILDGPGFAEVFLGVMRQGAVPLTMNPALSASEIVAVAAETGARLVVVTAERIRELTDLEAGPPVLVGGPNGAWAAVLRLN